MASEDKIVIPNYFMEKQELPFFSFRMNVYCATKSSEYITMCVLDAKACILA